MTDAFYDIFYRYLPASVIITFCAVVALAVVVWRVALMWHRWKSLPCRPHGERIRAIEDRTAHDGVDGRLSRIEGMLDMLVRVVPGVMERREALLSEETPLARKQSPRSLNANGITVSERFGCRDFFEKNRDWLLSGLERFNPRNALDAETLSLTALRVASVDDRFNGLKNEIYRAPALVLTGPDGGEKTVEIGLEDVLFVLSLYLRDAYLGLHPEIEKGNA